MPSHPERFEAPKEEFKEDWTPKFLESAQIIELLETDELSLESGFQGEKNPEPGQRFEVFSGPGKYAVEIIEAKPVKKMSRWNIRIKLIKREEE